MFNGNFFVANRILNERAITRERKGPFGFRFQSIRSNISIYIKTFGRNFSVTIVFCTSKPKLAVKKDFWDSVFGK